MIMDRRSAAVGAIFVIAAIAFGVTATGYRMGTLQRVGPGLFPLLVASGLGICGAVILVKSIFWSQITTVETIFTKPDFAPVVAVVAGVVAFGALIKPLGFAGAIPALVLLASLGNSQRDLRTTGLSILVLVPVCWVIFTILLKLPITLLPAGWGV